MGNPPRATASWSTRRGPAPRSHNKFPAVARLVRARYGAEHSARCSGDNCYRNYAQTNARQLASLLTDE